METEPTVEELLIQSFAFFREHRLYDGRQFCREQALALLDRAWHTAYAKGDPLDLARWGCATECLAQRYYIKKCNGPWMESIDTTLVAYWKQLKTRPLDALCSHLWLGYYFLLRYCDSGLGQSRTSKKAIADILTFLTEVIGKFRKQTLPLPLQEQFSTDGWGEMVYWAELVYGSGLCKKQVDALFDGLYGLKNIELQKPIECPDKLLQVILEFYYY